MYKIEPHLHTGLISKCGKMEVEELASAYKKAGYSGVIVTDHYNRITFDYLGIDTRAPGDKIGPFLEGYYRMKEAGEKIGLSVYKGAEIRFDECENDYLLYGYQNDLLAEPEKLFRMGIAGFSPCARGQGALLIQAHPYRKGCTPAIACYLDGVEILNLNPRHNSHNDRAKAYAEEFGLIQTAGSDCHQPEDVGQTGILVDSIPDSNMEMAHLLRSRRFGIIEPGK